jgi:hypothetical protein
MPSPSPPNPDNPKPQKGLHGVQAVLNRLDEADTAFALFTGAFRGSGNHCISSYSGSAKGPDGCRRRGPNFVSGEPFAGLLFSSFRVVVLAPFA